MQRSSDTPDLHQQLAEFEQQNPKVAEAIKLFGLSIGKYQEILSAMNPQITYVSNSTVSKDWKQQHGE